MLDVEAFTFSEARGHTINKDNSHFLGKRMHNYKGQNYKGTIDWKSNGMGSFIFESLPLMYNVGNKLFI